jgi:hypothetical protein
VARSAEPVATGTSSHRRARGVLVGAAAATLLAAGCSGSSGTHHAATTTTTSTTTVPTTTGPAPTADCTTPTLATRSVLAGWAAQDRAITGTCATVTVVNTLFAYRGSPAGAALQGCGGPDPGVPVCTFSYSGGTGRFTLQGTESSGWSVQDVQLAKS